MFKSAAALLLPDPYFSGEAGFVGSSIEELHADMAALSLPATVPQNVRRVHDGIRHAYIYAFFSYDLLTVAAGQTFPCLEFALRERIGEQFAGRVDRHGNARPVMLPQLLEEAKKQGLLSGDIAWVNELRKMLAHGSDSVFNPPMFLDAFKAVTAMIAAIYAL